MARVKKTADNELRRRLRRRRRISIYGSNRDSRDGKGDLIRAVIVTARYGGDLVKGKSQTYVNVNSRH